MRKPFDGTMKEMVDLDPAAWARLVAPAWGLPAAVNAAVVDADLSTVSLPANKLLRLAPPHEGILHFEAFSSWDGAAPGRLLTYNVLAEYRLGGPVYSAAVLLAPQANATAITGRYARTTAAGVPYVEFRYAVVRVWELELGPLLAGPVGTLPLALLTDEARPDIEGVVREVNGRLDREVADAAEREALRIAGYILLGLRYSQDEALSLYRGVGLMRESSTYRLIFGEGEAAGEARGRVVELRETIRELGEERFGSPPAEVVVALDGIADAERLRRMRRRLHNASDWADLLATP